MEDFTGFDADALTALRDLPGRTKQDRQANEDAYDHLVDTTKRFCQAVGDRVRETISPSAAVEPRINGSISPFNRDLRFAKDRSRPYKDHLMVNFWDGPDKRTAPTLRVRVTPTATGFGGGAAFSKSGIDRFRTAVAGDAGVALAADLDRLAERHPGLDRPGPELKRVPAGFDPEHGRADLLRHKSLHVRWEDPNPDLITTAGFVDWCGVRLDDLGPIHCWLVARLSAER